MNTNCESSLLKRIYVEINRSLSNTCKSLLNTDRLLQLELVIYFVLFFPLLVSTQSLTKVIPEEVGLSSERLDHLTNAFQDYIEQGELSGSVVLVARNGKIPYFKAFGKSNLEKNIPMEEHSIFRIASQTKAIISVGIMMLQEEGKLLISDPVGKYLPAFNKTTVAVPNKEGGYEVIEAKRKITIRDLLTHTAGIGYGNGPANDQWADAEITGWYFAHRDEPIQTTVNKIAKLPFNAQPGERWVYGYNTDILGALIEVVAGESLDSFLQKRILDPLDMNDTHFYLPPEKKERLTVVYSASDEGLKRAPNPGKMVGQGAYVEGPRKCFSGGAGYLSTAMDYLKFLQMMLNKGEFNGQRIISPKTVELMTTSHLGKIEYPWTKGTGFGLGFSVVENLGDRGELGSIGEYGWGGAYHSVYWVDPKEELIVVYFTQLIPAKGLDDQSKLRALVYQSITN